MTLREKLFKVALLVEKLQRISGRTIMLEDVLQHYTTDEINKILWHTLKFHADSIKLIKSTDEYFEFEIKLRDQVTLDTVNDLLGELNDTGFFDINYDGDRKTYNIKFLRKEAKEVE